MSPKLPVISAKHFIKVLLRAGFVIDRQKGSHVVLYHEEKVLRVVVPKHHKDLKRGLLAGLLHQAGISAEELVRLL